ncbi:hypothetical protein MUK42_33137, partial [Musa troglodytarum]
GRSGGIHKVGRGGGESPHHRSDPSASSSGMEDETSSCGGREGRRRKVCCYKSQLEQEVQILQKQHQDEINLHVALANALAKNAAPLLNSTYNIPDEIQEFIHSLATLEITVSNLEEELVTLHLQICNERAERHVAEAHLGSPPLTAGPPSPSSDCKPEHIFSSSISKSQLTLTPISMQKNVLSGCEDSQSITDIRSMERCPEAEILRSRNASDEGTEMGASVQLSDEVESKNNFPRGHIELPKQAFRRNGSTHEKYLSLSIWIIRHPSGKVFFRGPSVFPTRAPIVIFFHVFLRLIHDDLSISKPRRDSPNGCEHDAMEVQMVGLQKAFGVICYELATDCREMLVFLKGHAAEIQDKEGDELLFPEPAFAAEPSCCLHTPTVGVIDPLLFRLNTLQVWVEEDISIHFRFGIMWFSLGVMRLLPSAILRQN